MTCSCFGCTANEPAPCDAQDYTPDTGFDDPRPGPHEVDPTSELGAALHRATTRYQATYRWPTRRTA